MTVGESYQFSAVAYPDPETEPQYGWSSSNTSVLAISESGLATALAEGTSYVRVFLRSNPNISSMCEVNVSLVSVSKITIDEPAYYLYVGDSVAVSYTLYPEDAVAGELTWEIGNPRVAQVNAEGVVTGLSEGATVLTLSARDGQVTAECEIYVSEIEMEEIVLPESITIQGRDTVQIDVQILPQNASDRRIVWTVDHPEIATVTKEGEVVGVSPGQTVVTGTSVDGRVSASCRITVEPVAIQSIDILQRPIGVYPGIPTKIEYTIHPFNATETEITWKTEEAGVIEVDSEGNITWLDLGIITVFALNSAGERVGSCDIYARPILHFPSYSIEVDLSGTFYPEVELLPSYAKLVVTSDDPSIARAEWIDGRLAVTGLRAGQSTYLNFTDAHALGYVRRIQVLVYEKLPD